ncbi:hypothetical protein THOG10_270037 [Vibrio rotiferianus]|nr:hypothetical protein THOG10_270037 [Vibrio rotiferianus]
MNFIALVYWWYQIQSEVKSKYEEDLFGRIGALSPNGWCNQCIERVDKDEA